MPYTTRAGSTNTEKGITMVNAFMFVVLSVLLCGFAMSVRYAVTAQHVWHAEHTIRLP